jgi:hypothetical protein
MRQQGMPTRLTHSHTHAHLRWGSHLPGPATTSGEEEMIGVCVQDVSQQANLPRKCSKGPIMRNVGVNLKRDVEHEGSNLQYPRFLSTRASDSTP